MEVGEEVHILFSNLGLLLSQNGVKIMKLYFIESVLFSQNRSGIFWFGVSLSAIEDGIISTIFVIN